MHDLKEEKNCIYIKKDRNNPFKYIYYSHYYSRLFIVKYSIIFQISSIDTIKFFIDINKNV